MITYRILAPEEWDRLKIIADKLGGPIPEAVSAKAAIAENEQGQIVGILFLQLALHLEPIAIDPAHRGKVSFKTLAETLDNSVRESLQAGERAEYYVFTPDKRVAKMCKIHGMKQLPYRVWHKALENGG